MRLPFTFSELSVIRSGGRIFFNLLGIGVVLAGLYYLTIFLEKSITGEQDEREEVSLSHYLNPTLRDTSSQSPAVSRLDFPYRTNLTSNDGRTIEAIITDRPEPDQVQFRRTRDNVMFTIPLSRLSNKSRELVKSFPSKSTPPNPPESLPEDLLSELNLTSLLTSDFVSAQLEKLELLNSDLPNSELLTPELLESLTRALGSTNELPHTTKLTHRDGRSISVTLLERPSEDQITFRRHLDDQVFTIRIDQLAPMDQRMVRSFKLLNL